MIVCQSDQQGGANVQFMRVPLVCCVHMNENVAPAEVFWSVTAEPRLAGRVSGCVQENASAQATAAYPAVRIRDCWPEAREQISGVATLIGREGQRDDAIAVRYETHLSGFFPTDSYKMSVAFCKNDCCVTSILAHRSS